MEAYADEKLSAAGYSIIDVNSQNDSTRWVRSFDQLPWCVGEVILSIDTGKRVGARMGGWLGLRPEVALLKSALPEQTISEMDELFGKGVGSRRNIDCMYLFGERVKRGNKIDFELTTEEFDEHFVRRVPEIARAVDVIAGSREGLRACALDAGLSPHPPGRIQLFQFRAAALLMAAWYGRDVFNELVSEYRAAKDAGQWMKRAESDDFVDRFVEIVYSVPEESWAAMRVGGL